MSHPNEVFIANGQSHVFQFHDELNAEGQAQLKDQASAIDLAEIDRLVETLVRSNNGGNDAIAEDLEPAPFIPLPKNGGDSGQWQRARKAG